jgi:hypothetical protein
MHGFAEWLYAMINPPPYHRFILFNEVLSRYRDGPSGKMARYHRQYALPFGHEVSPVSIHEFFFPEEELCGLVFIKKSVFLKRTFMFYSLYVYFFIIRFFFRRLPASYCECFLAFARRHLCSGSSSTL